MKPTMFAQVLQLLPKQIIQKSIAEKNGDKHCKGFDSYDHFISMLYCQIAGASSLSEICDGLRSYRGHLSHMGVKHAPPKSTLAYANQKRDWKIFANIFEHTLSHFRHNLKMKGVKAGRLRVKNPIKIMDASIISVALSVMDWAQYQRQKGALKLHMMLDGHDLFPEKAWITDGKAHDLEFAREQTFDENTIIVVDRGYNDYSLYEKWNNWGCFFITRMKSNARYTVLERHKIPQGKSKRIISDELIRLEGTCFTARKITFYDDEKDEIITILTNNTSLAASTIGSIYIHRWQIEIFFRDLKQHFRIKSFVGTSPNAVLIQIWTALLGILIMKYMKLVSTFDWSMSRLITNFRMNLLSMKDLFEWLHCPFSSLPAPPGTQQPTLPGLTF